MAPNRPPLLRKPPAKRGSRPPGYWEDSWANGRRRGLRRLRGAV
jgi:hypothetical protein